jgi:hypothetical protein
VHWTVVFRLQHGGAFNITSAYFLVGVVGLFLWFVAYVLVVKDAFQQRTYGIPFLAICLNVTWEFMASFVWTHPVEIPVLAWLDRAGFFVDLVIVYTLLRFGRDEQVIPQIKRFYYAIFAGTITLAAIGQWTFTRTYYDPLGNIDAFMINLVMSVLFIFMLFARPELRGLSLPVAWAKGVGTACTSVMCFYWLPIIHPEIHDFALLNFLYVAIFLFDAVYIALLWEARRKLASARSA